MLVGCRLGLGVGVERIVLGNTMIRSGTEVRHLDVAGDTGLLRRVDAADGGVTVDGVCALGAATPGAGREHHGVVALDGLGDLVGREVFHICDDRSGPGLRDVVRLVGIADQGADLMSLTGQDLGQLERDLAVASDDGDS